MYKKLVLVLFCMVVLFAGFFVVNNQTNIENDQAELFIDNGEFPFKFSEKLHFAYKNNDKRLIQKIVKKANTKK